MIAELPAAIELLEPPVSGDDLRSLAHLLSASVASGEVVSFLAPLPLEQAEDWWRSQLGARTPHPIVLVARMAHEVVGTVTLAPAWAPNQPHRAEVVKLLVDHGHRRTGLGARLMEAAEEEARARGFRLLTLDAKHGEEAERLYRRLGWSEVGIIPGFAYDPDGRTPHDAVLFYKRLDGRRT